MFISNFKCKKCGNIFEVNTKDSQIRCPDCKKLYEVDIDDRYLTEQLYSAIKLKEEKKVKLKRNFLDWFIK